LKNKHRFDFKGKIIIIIIKLINLKKNIILSKKNKMVGAGAAQCKKNFKTKSFQKNFPTYFFYEICLILVFILYCKDINLVLKYPVFIEILQKIIKQKKYFVFMHTAKSLKD
jgi:hypothetical protein